MEGKINFVGLKPKHALEKLVRREMERWIGRESRSPEGASYDVKISCEGPEPFYYCRIEAEIGSCRFLANEGGKTPLDALVKTLRHARVSRAKASRTWEKSPGIATVA